MKAWKITITSWSDFVAVVAAETRSKAIASQHHAANDAGYDVPWTDFRARRAPKYDGLAAKAKPGETLGWRTKEWVWWALTEEGCGSWAVDSYGCLKDERQG